MQLGTIPADILSPHNHSVANAVSLSVKSNVSNAGNFQPDATGDTLCGEA